jgi:hypothetical protein
MPVVATPPARIRHAVEWFYLRIDMFNDRPPPCKLFIIQFLLGFAGMKLSRRRPFIPAYAGSASAGVEPPTEFPIEIMIAAFGLVNIRCFA